MNHKPMSLITFELSEISVFHEKDWDMVIKLMSEVVSKFEAALKKPISQLIRR